MISSEQKARLTWCCRRGMLELDLILSRFIDRQVDFLTVEQLIAFEKLLKESDPDLFLWLMGNTLPDDRELASMVKFIKSHDHA